MANYSDTFRESRLQKEIQSDMRQKEIGAEIDSPSLAEVKALSNRASTIIEGLREQVFTPDRTKRLDISFAPGKAAEMVGRSLESIRKAENAGKLPEQDKDERGRRLGYSLEQVNLMRDVFGTRPGRSAEDTPIIISVQNFKGGVGKSTVVTHLSQHLALKGYRTLVIDCDSQASTTTMFGLNPDLEVGDDETLQNFLEPGGENNLRYAVRRTYWDGIDLIPSNLGFYDTEYTIAAKAFREDFMMMDRLRIGVEDIAQDYDVVLLDPPPALGMISLSALRAANALIIPTPPSTVDFCSTAHFLEMLSDVLTMFNKAGLRREYQFIRVLATRTSEQHRADSQILTMMSAVFGAQMIEPRLKSSTEIRNAAARMMSVYELAAPITSREVNMRCRASLDQVNEAVELLVRKTWHSHQADLRRAGYL
ncbi:AAA family ATPase [Pelagibius sp. Alg239-R121]|uniref:AAA family ATPase n=1 Tax=Pelagibius sp. Alg239-R121 TaxID=2993448 RepID=UPI0024A69BC7|nr:AAA family ATPase [Pelagibius sp. Alg239-R121]